MTIWKGFVMLLATLAVAAGCTRPVVRDNAQPSGTKDQYTRIKRVAIFPLENYSDAKDAEKTVETVLTTSIRNARIFDQVEDVRFVRDVMKKLKITSTDILDKEVIKKFADEMNVQGILYGKVLAYGKGKEKDAGSLMTIDLSLVEPPTGVVLWIGNVTVYGGLTVGKVFGVTEGKTDIEVGRDGVQRLVNALADELEDARKREKKGIMAGLKTDMDLERAKLDTLKAQTGKTQGEIDKAKAEAKGIRDAASKDADTVKADLELQKAAFEAEKSKTQAAQQQIDQEKLKVEVERKKVAEDLKKIEEEKKALEEARKKAAEPPAPAPVPASAEPPAVPTPPTPASVPAPPAEPPAAVPAGAPPVPEPATPPPAGTPGQ